ncbi:glycoside hydrolase superfamily [Roridomyces roridus]|uniref:mannan endo-1,4-beta-mannosidase n=1 Tax=Roridomyces roridus TaxID=1738132 RepID=A0AAD7FS61_9AGAR|nr:glycoside hydrolase superfamily [Roridomyces roridus]
MIRTALLAAALLSTSVLAQVPIYGQCGGLQYTGSTTCVAGTSCVSLSEWFFPMSSRDATTTATSSSGSTTTSVSSVKSTSTNSAPTSTASSPTATGFIKTSGTKFTLNGAPYTVVGTNAYWLSLFGYGAADVNTALNDIVNSGATTVRGFNEVTTPTGIYFHLWNGTTATVNTGADRHSRAHGIRIIIALTNNWSDFGGMDVYTQQILGPGQFHDVFFTNPTLIAAYKSYVQAVVTRYVNEPTIMAWELSNEPRCQGTNTQPSPTCNNTSIDKNHLVAIGDEGFLNVPGDFDYPYSGTIGIDFVANLAIPTLDFGTFHDNWGESANTVGWGEQWITDHATAMTNADKPVIMEEFGTTNADTRPATYQSWQAGSTLSTGPTPNDGYMIFPTDPAYAVLQAGAAAIKASG